MPFVILAEAGTLGRDVHVDERCHPPSCLPSTVIPAKAGIHTR